MSTFQDTWRAGGIGQGPYVLKPRTNLEVPLTIDGISTNGAADTLFRVRNSAGSVLFSVDNSGNLSFAGSGVITIDQTVTGNLVVNGNTTLGNAVGDTLTVNATSTFNTITTFNEQIVAINGINASGTSYFGGTAIFNNAVKFTAGTASNPSITFQDDQNTGMYSAAADTIGVALGGTGAYTNFYTSATHTVTFRNPNFAQSGTENAFVFDTTAASALSADVVFTVAANGVTKFNVAGTGLITSIGSAGMQVGSGASTWGIVGAGTNTDITMAPNGTGLFKVTAGAGTSIAATAATSGVPTLLTVTSPAHTGLTAATEDVGVNFNLSATKTWSAGAGPLANQREFYIQAPTYVGNVAGALTITDAYTAYISGAPTAGANMTITRPWGLGVNANIGAGAGTVSLPSHSFISDPDTGMYSGGADSLRFTVAGSDRFTISTTAAQFIIRIQGATNEGYYASSALGSRYVWVNAQTNDAAFITTTPSSSNSLFISENDDIGFDFAHAIQTNPTLFIHSANQATTEWVSFAHDQTNAVYSSGKGAHTFTVAAATSGVPNTFVVTGAAHTGLTAATEDIGVNFNLSATKTWATGAGPLATQREFVIQAPTYSGNVAGALTITDAATLAITGAPITGTNITLTNAYALLVQSGKFKQTNNSTSSFSIINENLNAGNAVQANFRAITDAGSFYFGASSTANTSFGGAGFVYTDANVAFQIWTNNAKRMVISNAGNLAFTPGVSTSGATTAMDLTMPANTGITAGSEATQLNFNNSATQTWATGAIATQRFVRFQQPTMNAVAGSVVTTGINVSFSGAPSVGANVKITNPIGVYMGGNTTQQAAAGFSYSNLIAASHTLTFGNADLTQVTSSVGVANFRIGQVTVVSSGAHTIDTSASLYIEGPLVAGAGPVTLTNNYALFVDAGNVRLDGAVLLGTTTAPTVAGSLSMTQAVGTSGSPNAFLLTAGAHTTLAKNTEASDIYFNLTRTVQFATVDTTFTKQRAVQVGQPTYGFVGGSTISVAKTWEFLGAPLAGTNATITTGINVAMESWAGTNATDISLDVGIPGIALSTGSVTERSALKILKSFGSVNLGDQTANLTNLYGINVGATSFTSTTNTRTVTGNIASVYIAGALTASTNVTFSANSYSLFVDSGASRFDGAIIGSQGTDIASNTVIVIPTDGNVFELTGTTAVTLITKTNYQDGHEITLIANENVTITHGTATSGSDITILLAGAGNFAMTANDTLKLVLSSTTAGGQAWREISRTAI